MKDKSGTYQNYLKVSIILLIVGIAVALAQYKIPSIMPAIMESFEMDVHAASWLMSIFTFVGIFLALPTGVLAKKFGSKNMVLAAVVILLIGSLIGAFATSSAVLIFSRAIEGVALIFCAVGGPLAIQQRVAPDKVGTAMGIWALWVSLGSFFGGVLTPAIYDATGFQGVWLIFAGLAVVAAVLVFVFIKPVTGSVMGDVEQLTAAAVASGTQSKASYQEFFKLNTLLFLAGFMTFNMVLLAMLAFSPTFMQTHGVDAATSGLISTLPMVLAVVSSPLFGVLADKTGRVKMLLLISMVVMGPCACVLLTTTGPLVFVAAVVMGLIGLGAPAMILASYPYVLGRPELMAVGMGLLVLTQSLGQFLGTSIVPLLLEQGWMFTGICVMITGLVGTGLFAMVKYSPIVHR